VLYILAKLSNLAASTSLKVSENSMTSDNAVFGVFVSGVELAVGSGVSFMQTCNVPSGFFGREPVTNGLSQIRSALHLLH